MQRGGRKGTIVMGLRQLSLRPTRLRSPFLLVIGLSSICFLFLLQRLGLINSPINGLRLKSQTISLACLYPKTDPFNPEITKMYKSTESLKCIGAPTLTFVKNRRIFVNKTRVASLHSGTFEACRYRELYRAASDDGVQITGWKRNFTDWGSVRENVEFLHVVCKNTRGENISQAYHTLFLNDKNAEVDLDVKLKKRNAKEAPDETLNVIMIGVDGTSRNQIIRDMPKTYSFLTEDLQAFDMEMYSQVGVNTFPNYLALLAGESISEVSRWWDKRDPTDALDLIWDTFKQSGYRTLYTEDMPRIVAFNYQKKGFLYKPVQYYSRPLSFALEKDISLVNMDSLCVGDVPEMIFHLNYVRDFASIYRGKPYFAFLFNTRLTHEGTYSAGMIDGHVHASLKRFSKENLLNNTLLIFFTDHGPRWGNFRKTFQGSVEGRSPIGLFAFPQWFVKKYPDLFNNFRINAKRLTSHFDTHATLLDIVNFKSKGPRVSTRHGISLFQEISPLRTCKTASIPDEFCLCGESRDNIIDANSTLASKLAAAVLKTINEKRIKEKCAELVVDKILSVYQLNLMQEEFEEGNQTAQYKVTLQTKPGGAQYQGHVSKRLKNSELSVGTNIIRLNMYRGTAECVDDALVRPFCYCLNLIWTERPLEKRKVST